MNFKYIATAALLTATLAAPAQAAIITTTSSGTIYSGKDVLGLFGDAGANLAGQHYQMSFSIDTDDIYDAGANSFWSYQYANANAFTVNATVNNQSFTGTFTLQANSQAFRSNGFTLNNGYRSYDQVYADAYGSSNSYDSSFNGNHSIYSATSAFTGITLDALSNITRTLTAGDGSYANFSFWSNDLGETGFNATGDIITVSNSATDVPEPATLGLLGLGLAGLAASRRKRAQQ